MGYMHINNLYKDQRILAFRRCYALEKVHGTSAHIAYTADANPQLRFFSGGERHDNFVKLFNVTLLTEAFMKLGHSKITVYGEAYGGKCQGMSRTYGPQLSFIVFDVLIGDNWLSVPDAAQVAAALGLEFVPWHEVSTEIPALDAERGRPSEVAERRGIVEPRKREGVVLRPPFEVRTNNGERVMAKHKQADFEERATPQRVADPAKLAVLDDAAAVAAEWVTEMRLTHVLDKLRARSFSCEESNASFEISDTPIVISAMIEDVMREAAGEVVDSRDVRSAIGRRAADLFKSRIRNKGAQSNG